MVGVGQEIRIGFLRVVPELRYMRWLKASFISHGVPGRITLPDLQSNGNSLEFLVGVLKRWISVCDEWKSAHKKTRNPAGDGESKKGQP